MNNIDKYLKTFHDEIWKMDKGNLVIGGIHALKLHGLNIEREPGDCDIVVYAPHIEQEEFLESLVNNGKADDSDEPYRSYKLIKDGLTLDFLVEREKCLPHDLLMYENLRVQSVRGVIEAKSEYKGREKDIEDCKNLKHLNFNLQKIKQDDTFERDF